MDGGAECEASLERAGAEASRAAGGFGSSGSGVGTLSDICLLTAAGAAGWIVVVVVVVVMVVMVGGTGELEHSATSSTSIFPRTDNSKATL